MDSELKFHRVDIPFKKNKLKTFIALIALFIKRNRIINVMTVNCLFTVKIKFTP
jgi:hypothetical protein